MHIYIGQPLAVSNIKQITIDGQPFKVIQGKHFTYYVQTHNGYVVKVIAKSPRQLAPISHFIQNYQACTRKVISTMPLRMSILQYNCPQGKYEYKTFGVIGNLTTEVKEIR